MLAWIKSEPVYLMAFVQAAIGLGTSFGLHWSAEQIGSVLALTAAVLAVITRSQVTPTSSLPPGVASAAKSS